MKQITLTQGLTALVDDEDYELVSKHKWHAHFSRGSWYARRSFKIPGTRKTGKEYLHRLLMGDTQALVDHVNGNGLDNRRGNLRHATGKQNQGNAKLRKDNTSGVKGAYRSAYQSRTCSSWRVKCAQKYVGTFARLEDAAVAYDCAAIAQFGDRARTNHDVWRYITGNDLVLAQEAGVI